MSDTEPLLAADGILAREGAEYAELKLTWMERYLPPALTATKSKVHRVYLDLFAGPGVSVYGPPGQRKESESGGLRAIRARGAGANGAGFTSAILVNLDPRHHAALQERISRIPDAELGVPRDQIECILGDANDCLPQLLSRIPVRGYAFVFADPENAGQFPWASVEALQGQGHQSVDLYMLFPWGMDLVRHLPWGTMTPEGVRVHTDFFGCIDWKPIVERYHTPAFRRERSRDMRALYLDRLRSRWAFTSEVQPVALRGEQILYYMFFASSNDAGRNIAEGVVKAIAKEAEQPRFLL